MNPPRFSRLHGFIRILIRALIPRFPTFFSRIQSSIQFSRGIGYDGGVQSEVNRIFHLWNSAYNDPPLIYDVGGNIGEWSICAQSKFSNSDVVSFEPSKFAFAKLKQATESNKRISVHQIALSNFSGTSNLFTDNPGSALASLSKRDLGYLGLPFETSEEVSVMRLEDFCFEFSQIPDILKIDVEGHELNVLLGATRVLPKISIIQCEFGGTDIDSRTFFKDLWNLLNEYHFDVFRVTPSRLLRLEKYEESLEIFSYANYIALNKSFSFIL